jgi:sterol desaturase/sphingolipid hydroxylase (fatty acid hydroxylase superfamily)
MRYRSPAHQPLIRQSVFAGVLAGVATWEAPRPLRLSAVTPDMHRVHHSIITAETNSNFRFNPPWWVRLPGAYRAEPAI